MLGTLASDLLEFVSTVKADTVEAVTLVKDDTIRAFDRLDAVVGGGDENLSEAEQEARYRMGLVEIYTLPLEPLRGDTSKNAGSDQADTAEGEEEEDVELKSFLEAFDVLEKTDDIAALLEHHESTLKARFEELVPLEVSYEEFWERFFFRCDPVRIERAWNAEQVKNREARKKRVDAVKKVIGKPVNRLVVAPLHAVARAISGGYDAASNDAPFMNTPEELADLHHAIAASNQRIAALRTNLDEAKTRLEATERMTLELQASLDKTKTALQDKDQLIMELEVKLMGDALSTSVSSPSCTDSHKSDFRSGIPTAIKEEAITSGKEEEGSLTGTENSESEGSMERSRESTVYEDAKAPSPVSVMSRLRLDPTSVFKLAAVGLWRRADAIEEEDPSVSDGWGSEEEDIVDALF